jgi:hypothetical protein
VNLVLVTSQNPRKRYVDDECTTETVQNGGLVQKLVNNHNLTSINSSIKSVIIIINYLIFPTLFLINLVLVTSQNPRKRQVSR